MNTTADAAYYDLGPLKEGKINVKSFSDGDSKGQNIPCGSASLVASAKIYNTDKTNVLKVLDAIMSNEISHVLTGVNGTVVSPDGLAKEKFGTKVRFVCDADSDKNRYWEIGCDRIVVNSELTALLTTAAPAVGTPAGTDVLYPLLSLARSGIVPAGFSKVEIRLNPSGTYMDVGPVKNGKLIVEGLGETDSEGMTILSSAKIDLSFDAFQASATEMAQMDDLLGQVNDYKITLLDGTAITLNNQCGVDVEYANDQDSNGNSKMKFAGTGIVVLSALDAIFA